MTRIPQNLILIGLFFLFSHSSFSQINKNRKVVEDNMESKFDSLRWKSYFINGSDFSDIDESAININDLYFRLDSLLRLRDKLKIQQQIDSINYLYYYVSRDKVNRNYGGVVWSVGPVFSDYKGINELFEENNINTLNHTAFQFTYCAGLSIKRNKLFHTAFLNVGLPSKTETDLATVSIWGAMFNYDLGVAVVDKTRFHIFPFAGVFYKPTFLTIKQKVISANNISNSNDFIDKINNLQLYSEKDEFSFTKNEIGSNFGVEFDYHLTHHEGLKNGLVLGLRCGINTPWVESAWRINNEKVSNFPDIYFNKYFINLIVKLVD